MSGCMPQSMCKVESFTFFSAMQTADKEFEDLCFEFGIELDDIVSMEYCQIMRMLL